MSCHITSCHLLPYVIHHITAMSPYIMPRHGMPCRTTDWIQSKPIWSNMIRCMALVTWYYVASDVWDDIWCDMWCDVTCDVTCDMVWCNLTCPMMWCVMAWYNVICHVWCDEVHYATLDIWRDVMCHDVKFDVRFHVMSKYLVWCKVTWCGAMVYDVIWWYLI